jgi:hypothetical protein
MKLLKQSTAVTVKVGPFYDSTDGVTLEASLTLSQSDCILFKNNGAGAQKNDSSSATYDTAGMYGVPLNATDTATLGPLKLVINESGALGVWDEWMVVPENIYNSLVLLTSYLNVNLETVLGLAPSVQNFSAATTAMQIGTVDNTAFTATANVLETSSITTAASDHWVGATLIFTSGTLAKQRLRITAYSLTGGRGRFTYTTATSAPANGTTFVIV